MSYSNIFHFIDLQLFAEGTGTGDGGAAGATGDAAGPQAGDNGQAAAAETNTTPDLGAEFEELIKGKYKDQYDARVKDTIQKRLKSSKETVDKYNSLAPTLDLLAGKYGVEPGDIEALNTAITEDDSYYEDEALERGITVQQLKEIRKMERENADMRRQLGEQQARENAERLYSKWMHEAEQTQAVYPTFDLQTEMQDKRFTDLLKSNVDVKTAFEVLHKDDIIQAGMQYTAQKVEQQVANAVRANGSRPAENGINAGAATHIKSDVSALSKKDRADIYRRVMRGEKVTLG